MLLNGRINFRLAIPAVRRIADKTRQLQAWAHINHEQVEVELSGALTYPSRHRFTKSKSLIVVILQEVDAVFRPIV